MLKVEMKIQIIVTHSFILIEADCKSNMDHIYVFLGVLIQIKAQNHLKSEECRTPGNAEVTKLPSKQTLSLSSPEFCRLESVTKKWDLPINLIVPDILSNYCGGLL
jgi:hypothetical protein